VLVFHIKQGDVEGTDVSGLTVAAVADTPKVMTDGNWRLGVIIDSAASDERRRSSEVCSPARSAGRWKRWGR